MEANYILIPLLEHEAKYLKEAIFLGAELNNITNEMVWSSSTSAQLKITIDTAEKFRDKFTERLATAGFDIDYELTAEGYLLEKLIDIFY